MSSILPFAQPVEVRSREVPLAKTWAWDMDALEYRLEAGKMVEVVEDEAIKIWIWKLIATERRRWPVYSWGYGNDYATLIGHGYSRGFIESEAKRIIREAIMASLSDYVTDIRNIWVVFSNRRLMVTLTVDTIYSRKAVMVFDL